ncbi:MAG: hypothetical protein JO182_06090 [Acidobacteriaceae bacterium]|nr:hypothetical protein [Acidobacteriaceae bacterium]
MKNTDSNSNRREFIGRLGAALGGVAFAGGGARFGYGQSAIPNGYNFYCMLQANDGSVYNGQPNPVAEMTAAVMLGTNQKPGGTVGFIYMHGTATDQVRPGQPAGVFQVNLDYSKSKPQLMYVALNLAQGDTLHNIIDLDPTLQPVVVGRLGTGACNSSGKYATTIVSQDTSGQASVKSAPGVYIYDPEVGSWTKVAKFGDPSPDGGLYGGGFGDVAIDDEDNVTIVASTTAAPTVPPIDGATSSSEGAELSSPVNGELTALGRRRGLLGFNSSQALIHVPGKGKDQPFLLLKTGDMLPGSNAVIENFGLIDVSKDKQFIVQVNARRLDIPRARSRAAVVQGPLARRHWTRGLQELRLVAAPLALSTLRSSSVAVGDCFMGPRIGSSGRAAVITHEAAVIPGIGANHQHQLFVVDRGVARRLSRVGQRRRQQQVGAIGAPVLSSASSLTYYTELMDDGSTQLIVSDGTTQKTILKSGDQVEGRQVTEILYGYHSTQVDDAGRLAFAAEFLKNPNGDPTDPNNIVTCLVVGVPA